MANQDRYPNQFASRDFEDRSRFRNHQSDQYDREFGTENFSQNRSAGYRDNQTRYTPDRYTSIEGDRFQEGDRYQSDRSAPYSNRSAQRRGGDPNLDELSYRRGRAYRDGSDDSFGNRDQNFRNRNQDFRSDNRQRSLANQNSGYRTDYYEDTPDWMDKYENERSNARNDTYRGSTDTHRGKGPKGYQRSDQRIQEDISDRLSYDGSVDASDIELKVNDCEVTMDGQVDSKYAKRRAEDCADSVSGVTHVQNNLRVQSRSDDRGKGTQNSSSQKSKS